MANTSLASYGDLYALLHRTGDTARPLVFPVVVRQPIPVLHEIRLTLAGVLTINKSIHITLTQNAQFSPLCTAAATSGVNGTTTDNSTVINIRDPFYASIAPQFFAIAAATVVAYLLVIIIFITPGTFFVGGPGGGRAFLGRRGMISGTYGSSSVVGIGRRPWLQKIAALSVAISLPLASADTFEYCQQQYDAGYSDAGLLVDQVNSGLEIRVIRVISDTFLWLAQVQTLIRLFPRHKEKVAIKWLGFALILFDTIFSILNNLVYQSTKTRPRLFADAIPALSYLFELSIGLIYASCVIYYSLCKRRFAFWHAKMRNICLVALFSLMAVLIPVVFFVLDVSNSDVATWGDYIRWVGSAAASVVVWEWVERIEALERDERKDGILGREIFDGDEMLDITPSEEVVWPGRSPNWRNDDGGGTGNASGWTNSNGIAHRPLRTRVPFQSRPPDLTTAPNITTESAGGELSGHTRRGHPALPPQAVTPISRADTSSASTVYAVRRLPPSTPSPQIPEDPDPTALLVPKETFSAPSDSTVMDVAHTGPAILQDGTKPPSTIDSQRKKNSATLWRPVPNPFKRRRASPPAEVAGAQSTSEMLHGEPATGVGGRPSRKSGVEAFGVSQKRKFRTRGKGQSLDTPLEVTVIPARRRGQRTWSPDDLVDPGGDEPDTRNEHEASQTDDLDEVSSVHQLNDRADLPVTIIPAPTRSRHRTWSPQETDELSMQAPSRSPQVPSLSNKRIESPETLVDPRKPNSLREEPIKQIPDRADKTPLNGQGPSGTLLSRRGTLIISEVESRNSTGSHKRSLYSRTSPQSVRTEPTPVGASAESFIENQTETPKAEHERSAAHDPRVEGDNAPG
jgi:PalH/RIM21